VRKEQCNIQMQQTWLTSADLKTLEEHVALVLLFIDHLVVLVDDRDT